MIAHGPHPYLRPGQKVRIHCLNDLGQAWTTEGIVVTPHHDGYLFLEGVDGIYSWDCIRKIEFDRPRGERWDVKAVVHDQWVVVNNQQKVLREFVGPDAVDEAVAYIDTLPDVMTGRYGLDACIPSEDAHCDDCGCVK